VAFVHTFAGHSLVKRQISTYKIKKAVTGHSVGTPAAAAHVHSARVSSDAVEEFPLDVSNMAWIRMILHT
jgi:hypothetical protein